ncbi:MAG: 50S ribosomal protein L3, partial [Patescibacteria group bacterium]
MDTILGSKVKMEQVFLDGKRFPATRVKAGPCVVTQVKTMDSDGYWAIQLGFGERKLKNVTKPMQGHLKAVITDAKAPSFLAEVRLNSESEFKVGDKVNFSDVVSEGDTIT